MLRTLNAGKAEVYGVDFEAHYRPPSIDGLSLNLAANWNKTKFLELNNVPCFGGQTIAQGCNQIFVPAAQLSATQQLSYPNGRYTAQNLAGIPFVRAPEWRINFGFDYELPVGNGMRLQIANTILDDDQANQRLKEAWEHDDSKDELKVDLQGLERYFW